MCEHDTPKCLAEADSALLQSLCQRSGDLAGLHIVQGNQRPNPQADKNVRANASGLSADLLQFASVPTQSFHEQVLEVIDVFREALEHRGWQHRTPSIKDVSHPLQEQGEVSCFAVKKRHNPDHGQDNEQDNDRRQESHSDEFAALLVYADDSQPRRQDVHEFIH